MNKKFHLLSESNFVVDHIEMRAVVNQTLDHSSKPVLDNLKMNVGNTTTTIDKRKPLDSVIETTIQSLPSVLEGIIIDALEDPIKRQVQTLLDDVQVEKLFE